MHGGYIYGKKIGYDFSVNINPYVTPEIRQKLCTGIGDKLQNYPDPYQWEFREAVSKLDKLDTESIWGGSGASELFMAIVRAVNPHRALVLTPSFYGYVHALRSLGFGEIRKIYEYPLQKENDFALTADFLRALRSGPQVDLLFIANPNNPTGRTVDDSLLADIIEVCSASGTMVVVDESFLRLSENGGSCKQLINSYGNLYVVDSFTKLFAVPGVRVGYVCSREENLWELKKQLPEWNMSIPAQSIGAECARMAAETDFTKQSLLLIDREREYLRCELSRLGFKVFPSDSSFLLFEGGRDLHLRLSGRGILIRDCSDYSGLGDGYYRISVRTHAENELLIDELSKL